MHHDCMSQAKTTTITIVEVVKMAIVEDISRNAMRTVLIPLFAQMTAGKSQTSVMIRNKETINEPYQKVTTLTTRHSGRVTKDWKQSCSVLEIPALTLTSTKTYPWKLLATKCHHILIRSMTLS